MKLILLAAALLFALPAVAPTKTLGDITVQSIWARATPPSAKTGVIYMTLVNNGKKDDKLIGASTPVAAEARLHTELMDHGVTKMRPIKSVDIKPGATAVLKPGGMHLMLMGLKQPLSTGHAFPVTLRFQHAPPLIVQVEVGKVGAAGMGDMGNMPGMKP
jgi:hypothetical protein